MKLFLCSDTITKELKPIFEDFANKKAEDYKQIAFITTGVNPTPPEKRQYLEEWLSEDKADVERTFKNAEITDVDIAEIQGAELKDFLEKQDLIFMNGGYTEYLIQQIHKSGLSNYLFELLESDTMYVGSSTGSMVMSETMSVAEFYPDEEEDGAYQTRGFGLLPFELFPHYDKDSHLKTIKENRKSDITYCLFKNGQAISYNRGEIKFHEGGVGEFEFLLPIFNSNN